MGRKVNATFNIAVHIFTLASFLFIASTSFFRLGRADYARNASIVYAIGAAVGLLITIGFLLLETWKIARKEEWIGVIRLGHISENPAYAAVANPLTKLAVIAGWTAIVGFLAFSGFQVWGSPDIYNGVEAFAQEGVTDTASTKFGASRAIFDVGFIPAYVEDMAAFALSAGIAMLILLGVWIAHRVTKSSVFKLSKAWYVFSIIIASPIAAAFFSRAHELVAGGNTQFFVTAWIFQTVNLYVIWFTGLFIPLAHFVHNSIFALGFAFVLSIAAALLALPLSKKGEKQSR